MYKKGKKDIETRKTRQQREGERKAIKLELGAELERGDLRAIEAYMNKTSKITYYSITCALNPNSTFWSPRVIEAAKEYIEAKKQANSDAGTTDRPVNTTTGKLEK